MALLTVLGSIWIWPGIHPTQSRQHEEATQLASRNADSGEAKAEMRAADPLDAATTATILPPDKDNSDARDTIGILRRILGEMPPASSGEPPELMERRRELRHLIGKLEKVESTRRSTANPEDLAKARQVLLERHRRGTLTSQERRFLIAVCKSTRDDACLREIAAQ